MSHRRPPFPFGHHYDGAYRLRPNDYDNDYPYDRGGGSPYPPPDNMTDESSYWGLGPRAGDEPPRRPTTYLNERWGDTIKLLVGGPRAQRTAALVTTPIFDTPLPIGYQLRFSTDGINFSSVMPVNGGVDVTLTKSLDLKAGPARERFGIDAGFAQPSCQVIARALTITVALAETDSVDLWVEAVACPLATLDCAVVVPPPPTTPAGFDTRTITRFAAVEATTYNIAADPKRAYLAVANQSSANLFVALGTGVNTTPGSEFATIVLPPGAFAGYNVDNWTGVITLKFDADDDAGYTLVTQGTYP